MLQANFSGSCDQDHDTTVSYVPVVRSVCVLRGVCVGSSRGGVVVRFALLGPVHVVLRGVCDGFDRKRTGRASEGTGSSGSEGTGRTVCFSRWGFFYKWPSR